jgi:hypothetical protein
MRKFHGILIGGALLAAIGVGPALAAPLGVATTRPPSDFSTLQVQTPNGIQAYNPDGYYGPGAYEARVGAYEATGTVVPLRPLRSGRAATVVEPGE